MRGRRRDWLGKGEITGPETAQHASRGLVRAFMSLPPVPPFSRKPSRLKTAGGGPRRRPLRQRPCDRRPPHPRQPPRP